MRGTVSYAPGDSVQLAGGDSGTVVGVRERSDEPGRWEILVRMIDGSVDSWDSDSLGPAPGRSRPDPGQSSSNEIDPNSSGAR